MNVWRRWITTERQRIMKIVVRNFPQNYKPLSQGIYYLSVIKDFHTVFNVFQFLNLENVIKFELRAISIMLIDQ